MILDINILVLLKLLLNYKEILDLSFGGEDDKCHVGGRGRETLLPRKQYNYKSFTGFLSL